MKMHVTAILASIALAAPAFAREQAALIGAWRQDDGKVTVRIAPCPASTDLCATVIDEKTDLSEARRLGTVIVSGIRPAGAGRWNGQFIDQGSAMPARIRRTAPNTVTFKICAFAFLCETKRFDRVNP